MNTTKRHPLKIADPNASPVLILVTGPTGTGKTTLARQLSTIMHVPVVMRDLLKSGMAGHNGPNAFAAYYELLGAHLDRGISVIGAQALHSHIAPAEVAPLLYRARTVVLECRTSTQVIQERLRRRVDDPRQHWSHPDGDHLDELASGDYDLKMWSDLQLGCPSLRVDTTDGYDPALDRILAWITSVIAD